MPRRRNRIKSAKPRAVSPDRRALGLYIHIPFCRKKCEYCDFYSLPVGQEGFAELADRYLAVLERHITESSAQVTSPVNTVYFGGGTPTVMGAKRLISILNVIKKRFALTMDCEITFEANPESADVKTLRALRRAGFNRLSLGVQSASDAELRLMGRVHDFAMAERAYNDARRVGFNNISVDLMYGTEGQTPESWRLTLETITAWKPEHISAYGLKVEEGTPLCARADSACLAGDDEQAALYLDACALLAESGYGHYEISNWALPGFESRHNLRYWRMEPYIGFGPAAHSDCYGARYSNVRSLESYMRGIELGGAVLDEYEDIRPSERASEYVMLSLRTSEGLDTGILSNTYRIDADGVRDELRRLTEGGLAVYEGAGRWRLSDEGFLVSNSIIAGLWSRMDGEEAVK